MLKFKLPAGLVERRSPHEPDRANNHSFARFFAYFFIIEKVRDTKENAGLLKEFRFPKLKILAFLLVIRVVLPSHWTLNSKSAFLHYMSP